MLSAEKLAAFPRVVIELGMGDGRLLERLAKSDPRSLHIGVELDIEQCDSARSRLSLDNALVMNRSFEELLPELANGSVDRFVAVLPDPAYIDEKQSEKWIPLYALAYKKLRRGGTFQIVTELTDELLQPVGDAEFARWKEWLISTFSSLGFVISGVHEGAPPEYSSRCLDQFRGDRERIRLVTLDLAKQ
jgi:tRNA G46 methylase TrmB